MIMKAQRLAIISLFVLLLGSCVDPVANYNSYELRLVIDYGDSIPQQYYEGAEVVLTNLNKSYSMTGYTSDSADVYFSDIEPGFYAANIVYNFNVEGTAYIINGLLNLDIFSSMEDTLETVLSVTNAFVIKQYYYSACLTPAGKQYSSDQFVEIHNNSEVLQYVDGLSIVEHESYSLEENYWNFIEDTIVARAIWTIPGDGDDYPLEPGASVVIARDGINHQDSIYGNPLCPVNLENADFEFWVESESGDDLDAPHAVNMIESLFTFRGTDYVFHTRGGSALALALIPGTQEDKQEFIDNHQVLKITSSDRYYGKVPNEYILDAVEVTWDLAHAIYKRFPLELDAGFTFVAAGSKSGLCVRRKVEEVIDGRYIYKDTNNSYVDFLKDVVPKPWINEE